MRPGDEGVFCGVMEAHAALGEIDSMLAWYLPPSSSPLFSLICARYERLMVFVRDEDSPVRLEPPSASTYARLFLSLGVAKQPQTAAALYEEAILFQVLPTSSMLTALLEALLTEGTSLSALTKLRDELLDRLRLFSRTRRQELCDTAAHVLLLDAAQTSGDLQPYVDLAISLRFPALNAPLRIPWTGPVTSALIRALVRVESVATVFTLQAKLRALGVWQEDHHHTLLSALASQRPVPLSAYRTAWLEMVRSGVPPSRRVAFERLRILRTLKDEQSPAELRLFQEHLGELHSTNRLRLNRSLLEELGRTTKALGADETKTRD